jgi:hypothetical protein
VAFEIEMVLGQSVFGHGCGEKSVLAIIRKNEPHSYI